MLDATNTTPGEQAVKTRIFLSYSRTDGAFTAGSPKPLLRTATCPTSTNPPSILQTSPPAFLPKMNGGSAYST
jgi:hypothetical protein